VRASLTGDFSAEKKHILEETKRRIESLERDKILTPSTKEVALRVGIVSVFRYSAGLVPWTRSELAQVTQLWMRGFKQAWLGKSSRGADGTPFQLSESDGGRGCPNALEVWIREVLEVKEQCLGVPGEIAELTLYQLRQSCRDRGCTSLNQLQRILRVRGTINSASIVELLLVRLDEQGLEVSSPWEEQPEVSIAEVLWPSLKKTWEAKERWTGCQELDPGLQQACDHMSRCLRALDHLGLAGIQHISQLRDSSPLTIRLIYYDHDRLRPEQLLKWSLEMLELSGIFSPWSR